MNYFVEFLIAISAGIISSFCFYLKGKKDSEEMYNKLIFEFNNMLNDRGCKLAVVEKSEGGERAFKFADKKLIDQFTKDFKEKMSAENRDKKLEKLGLEMILKTLIY